MTRALLPLLLALPLSAAAVEATVPAKLGFGGRLLASDGTPVNGVVSITFSLFDQATGGTATWSETQSLLLTVDGAYGTLLGTVNPLPDAVLLAPGQRFLEIAVNAGAPLSPRMELGASPFAAVARHVRGGTVDATAITLNGAPLPSGYRGVRSFSTSGTFTVPDGVGRVHVRAWGGGGAGGTIDSVAPKQAGGGGGGAYAEDVLELTAGATLSITVGTGGAVSGACTGNSGGHTSVALGGQVVLSAGGGVAGQHAKGGTCCPNGTLQPRGGAGGTATGAIALDGEPGWDANQGGSPGHNPMSPLYGRGGETVYDPNVGCTPGDAGKPGLVLLAY
ncbi:MAG: hypothetical protein FJ086_18655 [Deltaproteobacteria bacterium]|nr:hypothetical protein [Deltaproteobacteria bacterium]